MKRTVGIPQSVVDVEVVPLRIVNGMIVAAEISAILSDIGHAAERTVESRVEDSALAAPFLPVTSMPPKRIVPDCARLRLHAIEVPVGNLSLEISARLLRADVGDSDAHFDLFSCRSRSVSDNADVVACLLPRA